MVQIKTMHGSLRPVPKWSKKSACECWNTSFDSNVCEIVLQLFLVYFIVNFKDDLA